MEEKKMLGAFIHALRKEKGLTQEALASALGISNKAVSKWETFEANPDLNLIKPLAQILGVSTDELLQGKRNEKNEQESILSDSPHGKNKNAETQSETTFLGKAGTERRGRWHYEFVSAAKTKKGRPYLHVHLGVQNGRICRADGVIAIGMIAKGIVSLGLISFGLLSLGVISFGLLAIGSLTFGLVAAVGATAVSIGVSVGAVAVGSVAIGAIAIGLYSVGAVAIGLVAHTGIKGIALGLHTFFH